MKKAILEENRGNRPFWRSEGGLELWGVKRLFLKKIPEGDGGLLGGPGRGPKIGGDTSEFLEIP